MSGNDEAGRRVARQLKKAVLHSVKAPPAPSSTAAPKEQDTGNPYWQKGEQQAKYHTEEGQAAARRRHRGPEAEAPHHPSGESTRVVPEREIGETLVIGKFKGRTRTTIANVGARRALEIIGPQ